MTAIPGPAVRLDLEPVVLAMAREQAGIMGLDLDRCEPEAVERLKQQLLGTLVVGLPVVLEQLVAAGWRAPEAPDCATDCPECPPAAAPVLPTWPYAH